MYVEKCRGYFNILSNARIVEVSPNLLSYTL